MAPSVKRMRRALAASGAAVVAVACAAAGSAGSLADSTYERQMKSVGKELSASLLTLPTATGIALRYPVEPTAARDAAAVLTRGQVKLHNVTSRLKTIRPPVAVATEHAKLVQATVELASEIKPVIAKLHQGYLIAASKLLSLPGLKKISDAVAVLDKRGYRIGT
jgi:hypothetical protein